MDDPAFAFILAKFLCLAAVYVVGLFIGVFFHELGHALAALLATSQRIGLEVGRSRRPWRLALGRLELRLGLAGFRNGFTRYDRAAVGKGRQLFVAASGPLASATACAACMLALERLAPGGWAWIVAVGLLVANLRILVVSLWPMEYRPDGAEGEVWLSDALDIWRLLRRR